MHLFMSKIVRNGREDIFNISVVWFVENVNIENICMYCSSTVKNNMTQPFLNHSIQKKNEYVNYNLNKEVIFFTRFLLFATHYNLSFLFLEDQNILNTDFCDVKVFKQKMRSPAGELSIVPYCSSQFEFR